MAVPEQRLAYRGFLRSGAYPALPARMRGTAGRLAGMAAIAAIAAGAGYKVTQRIIATDVSSASVTRTEPRTAAIGGRHVPALAGQQQQAVEPPTPVLATPLKLAPSAMGRRLRAPHEAARLRPLSGTARQTLDSAALSTVPPSTAWSAQADVSGVPRRAQELADQVGTHASGQLSGSQAAVPAPGLTASLVGPTHAPAEDALARAVAVQAALVRPVAETSEAPPPRVHAPMRQQQEPHLGASPAVHDVTPHILALAVRGSLAASTVRHSVERVLPALSGCYARATRQRAENGPERVQLRFMIDETGRAHSANTEEAAPPGFEQCLRASIAKLACRAPDTGTVQASLLLSFSW